MSTMTKPMGMLLQDPSVAELYQDYAFSLTDDYLARLGSSKLVVEDNNESGEPLYKGLDWEKDDLSFATLNQHHDFIDNPQFHQVNTFAVTACALTLVEHSIGREMKWKHGGPLVLRPHAFEGPNAFYDSFAPSLNFGFFTSPFRRTPIWTCLSHDIVTHELGHAILDSYRPLFNNSEEIDTGALHESIGDLMAMFSALEHKAVVERLFRDSGGDMLNLNLASGLAEEFGIGLQGVGFPFLRSALEAPNYLEADEEPHNRSTVWTAAIYEILVELVKQMTTPAIAIVLQNAPSIAKTKGVAVSTIERSHYEQAFTSYYQQPQNKLSFDAFYEAITRASRRVRGMVLRALQDIPPTGVTLPTTARVLYNADARWFPDDAIPREIARTVFVKRQLWNEATVLDAPAIGQVFASLWGGSIAALTKAVFQNAAALRIPLSEGAQVLTPHLSKVVRRLDAETEERGEGIKEVCEYYLYYTYRMSPDTCMGIFTVYKGGTLVMDENWNALQLVTDPDYIPDEEDIEPAVQAVRIATKRFTRAYHRALRAYRDGLVDAEGKLPNGEFALPFMIKRQSSGGSLLIRPHCHLNDHLKGIAANKARFPFALND